jgi:hypothetical protein
MEKVEAILQEMRVPTQIEPLAGATVRDLFVYSPVGSMTEEVHRDEQFLQEIIPRLKIFISLIFCQLFGNKEKERFLSK